jgi:predicted ATPase
MVPRSIAATFDIAERPDRQLLAAVEAYLENRSTLIVLDNCEHLVEACAEVASTLLRRSHRLQIIATSREALNVSGETIWRVSPLSAPAVTDSPGPADLTNFEAVRLFVERATAYHTDFHITRANATAVAEVCRGLDGIPLAIELAAARLPLLTAEQIAARLTDRFGLLTRGAPRGCLSSRSSRTGLARSASRA